MKEGWADSQPPSNAEKHLRPPLLLVLLFRLSSFFVRGVGMRRGPDILYSSFCNVGGRGAGLAPHPRSNAEKARRPPRPPLSSSSSVAPLLALLSSAFFVSSFFVSWGG